MTVIGAQLWIGAALLGTVGVAEAQVSGPAASEGAEEAAEPGSTGRSGDLEVICVVSGYDVVLRNHGPIPIPVGTVIEWEVPFARMNGSYVLSSPIDPGGQLFQTAVLGSSYLGPGTPCHAEISTDEGGNDAEAVPDE